MSTSRNMNEHGMQTLTVAVFVSCIVAGILLLRLPVRFELAPMAVLFGWTQVGGL
jgi:hypothetical protein